MREREKPVTITFPDALLVLSPRQVMEIDRALAGLGPFGEIRLIKVKGRLRFIQRLESHDFLSEENQDYPCS